MSWKAALAGVMLGGALLLGGATSAQAHDRNCSAKIHKERFKLERDIARHGFFSRQAEHRRRKIRDLNARCFFDRRGGWWRDDRGRDRDWRWDGRDRRWDRRDRDYRWHRRRDR